MKSKNWTACSRDKLSAQNLRKMTATVFFLLFAGPQLLAGSEAVAETTAGSFAGVSIITEKRDWLDIQLMRSGEQQAISIRKYTGEAEDSVPAEKMASRSIGMARYPAGAGLSVDEVIELSRKIPREVLEAALLELRQPFRIDSKALTRLADGGVPLEVVDLMVALSFPDRFYVESHGITAVKQSGPGPPQEVVVAPSHVWLPFGYWSIYHPFSPWYWSYYMDYGYWGPAWGIWPRGYGGGGDRSGGRLISGRGYSRVDPSRPGAPRRYAQPLGNSGNSGTQNQSNPNWSPGPANSSGNRPVSSSGTSGGVSSRSSRSVSPGPSPSASPGGYHRSGGNNAGAAKPRE